MNGSSSTMRTVLVIDLREDVLRRRAPCRRRRRWSGRTACPRASDDLPRLDQRRSRAVRAVGRQRVQRRRRRTRAPAGCRRSGAGPDSPLPSHRLVVRADNFARSPRKSTSRHLVADDRVALHQRALGLVSGRASEDGVGMATCRCQQEAELDLGVVGHRGPARAAIQAGGDAPARCRCGIARPTALASADRRHVDARSWAERSRST